MAERRTYRPNGRSRVYDDLIRVYPNITPFKFTAHSKVELIQRLVVAVEQRRVTWPRAWEVLTNEMKRYEYRLSPSGQLSYNAPDGYHDDCVIALGLANHGFAGLCASGHFHAFASRQRSHATLAPTTLTLRF